MNVHRFHQFLATQSGSAGERLSWGVAVNMIVAGNPVAAGSLVELIGVDVIPALIEADAPAPALMASIDAAAILRYRELPGLIARHGGRAVFVDWCLMAGYAPPPDWPALVTLYRGTLGCSPAQAAAGLHWSRRFDSAALFAARFADADLTGAIIVQAQVPLSRIACFVSASTHDEVIPDEAPAEFGVITGRERIVPAALREVARQERLQAQFGAPETYATDRRVGMEARARLAAAGVPRGAAILV